MLGLAMLAMGIDLIVHELVVSLDAARRAAGLFKNATEPPQQIGIVAERPEPLIDESHSMTAERRAALRSLRCKTAISEISYILPPPPVQS